MADKVFAAERTRQAIAAAEAGEVTDARTLLSEALALDPEYELAWLWFAAVTDDPGEEKFCLKKVKDLDPQHKAVASLNRLVGVKAKQPPELAPIIDPPPPEFITGYADEVRQAKRARLVRRLVVGLAVIAVVAALAAVWANSRVRTTYVAVVMADNLLSQNSGQEAILAAQWAAENWNSNFATSEQQVEIVPFFDDGDPEKAVQVAQQIVADGRFVAVIGHAYSSTSDAAAPVYQEAGMPAITPFATADSVTRDRPWYFRTVFDNAEQGTGMATYALGVEGATKAVVVADDENYAQSLREGFVSTFAKQGTIEEEITIPAEGEDREAKMIKAAAQIARLPDPGVIALMTWDERAAAFFQELSDRGVKATVMVPDALATADFYSNIRKVSPDLLPKTLSATPLTEGSLVGRAVDFYDEFSEAIGYQPGWGAGLTYDAVEAITEGMIREGASFGTGDLPADREKLREAWSKAKNPEKALPTLTGSLHFNENHSAVIPTTFNVGRSAPGGGVTVESSAYQLAPYSPQAGVSLKEQVDTGWAFESEGATYSIQRVVTTGFNINQIDELDPATQSFNADFFIWFKFEGAPGPPTEIEFVNAVDPALSLGEPVRTSQEGRQQYALYRVKGSFRANMDFANFPFDTQNLPITIQNVDKTAAQITYVADPDNLEQTQAERLASGTDASATIDQIPNWQSDSVSFYPGSVGNTGALGDPTLAAGSQGVTYSQLTASTTVSRDVGSFLVKNLLPLFLLVIVVYVSLWYPYKDAPARVTFGVTGILTGAVMLGSVTSSLPQVDYNVAIEWAYYAFIFLAGVCIVATLVGRHLTDTRQLSRVRNLDRIMRIGYPVFVFAVGLAYWFAFRG